MAVICPVSSGSGGMPWSGRPLRMTSPIRFPFTSCATILERTRSGPRAPVASGAWQKPHDCLNWASPRATIAREGDCALRDAAKIRIEARIIPANARGG